MSRAIRPIVSIGLWAAAALWISGCPQTAPVVIPAAPTPPAEVSPPRIVMSANPMFRLVIPPRSFDAPARLVAIFVRIQNIHDQPLAVRPERIVLELPDGSRRSVLDLPRALEIVQRTTPARAELLYLERDRGLPPGGLTYLQQEYWRGRLRSELLRDSLIAPGEIVEGIVVVDTGRRFASLQDTVIEAITEPAAENPPRPLRVLLGAPIDLGP